jgi:hypothetical protein
MKIAVNQLGLAAYIKMNGATLLSVEGKTFAFESEKTAAQWRVEYNNSCCMRHDALVCELRHHLKV